MSAPIQARASVQVVPASNCVRSRTRMPARQPGDTGVTVMTELLADLRVWPPRCRMQQLDLLGHQERPNFWGEVFDEFLISVDRLPVSATVGIVVELPQMVELIDRTGVANEEADQFPVEAGLLERRKELLIQLYCLRHLADVKRVCAQLI